MDGSLKSKYPFRLGTTSFIYPADYVSNVQRLAPLMDEIELLLFESSDLPSPEEVVKLNALADAHRITYNVHLPMDIDPAAGDPQIRENSMQAILKAMDRVAPLNPTTMTLHIPFSPPDKTPKTVEAWQAHAVESITRMLETSHVPAGDISIETLDYPPQWLTPIIRDLDLALCLDVGHIILYGYELEHVLDSMASRTAILHLHGVADGRDHRSLDHLRPEERRTISRFLNDFSGSVSIEVFSHENLNDSLDHFPSLMTLGTKNRPAS